MRLTLLLSMAFTAACATPTPACDPPFICVGPNWGADGGCGDAAVCCGGDAEAHCLHGSVLSRDPGGCDSAPQHAGCQ